MSTVNIVIPSSGGSGGASAYLEYAWVCTPDTAGQSITANSITPLTLTTEVSDSGGHGSVGSNQITLAAGTYYFEAEIQVSIANQGAVTLALYNVSDSSYVSRSKRAINVDYGNPQKLNGQFTIAAQKIFELRILTGSAKTVGVAGSGDFTLNTANADQRTTIKLWKLA